MDTYKKKTLLILLKIVMFVKRALVRFFLSLGRGMSRVNSVYERTIGTTLYHWAYTLQKKFVGMRIWGTGGMYGFFGRRSTLQVLLFVVLFLIMLPQTRLYTAEIPTLPGRNTLLYKMVGPGDQDFASEEYIIEEALLVADTPDRSWREGAMSADQVAPIGQTLPAQEEIAAVSVGGTALTKPTILPGNQLPTTGQPSTGQVSTGRTDTVTYTVADGDTIGVIAQRYGISVETILWANNLTARSYIRPGDELTILPTSGIEYTVARGDTVSSIARTYDVEASKIIAYNNLQKDGADIIIGETLIIPGGRKAVTASYTAPASAVQTPLRSVAAPPPSVQAPAGSGYIWPTAVRTITQYYGLQHTGLDIAGPIGTPIYAARSGTVIKSQDGWNGGYGNYIIIDHGGGISTLYGHSSVRYVELGEHVEQGQTIAAMGSTGRSTGPHLHFEVRINNKHTNPLQYIR